MSQDLYSIKYFYLHPIGLNALCDGQYAQLKLENTLKMRLLPKYIKDNIHNIATIWLKNMLGYLSLDISSIPKNSQFSSIELRSQKTVRFSKQMLFADKFRRFLRAKCRLFVIYLFRTDFEEVTLCLAQQLT